MKKPLLFICALSVIFFTKAYFDPTWPAVKRKVAITAIKPNGEAIVVFTNDKFDDTVGPYIGDRITQKVNGFNYCRPANNEWIIYVNSDEYHEMWEDLEAQFKEQGIYCELDEHDGFCDVLYIPKNQLSFDVKPEVTSVF